MKITALLLPLFSQTTAADQVQESLSEKILKSLFFGKSWPEFQEILNAKTENEIPHLNSEFLTTNKISNKREILENLSKNSDHHQILLNNIQRIDADKNGKIDHSEISFWNFMAEMSSFPFKQAEADGVTSEYDQQIKDNKFAFDESDTDKNQFVDFAEMLDYSLKMQTTTEEKQNFILSSNKHYSRMVAKWSAANFDYEERYAPLKEHNEEKFKEYSFMLDLLGYNNFKFPIQPDFIHQVPMKLYYEKAMSPKVDEDSDNKLTFNEVIVADWAQQPTGIAKITEKIYYELFPHKRRGEPMPQESGDKSTKLDGSDANPKMGQRELTDKMVEALENYVRDEFKIFQLMDQDNSGKLEEFEIYYWLFSEEYKESSELVYFIERLLGENFTVEALHQFLVKNPLKYNLKF